MRRYLSSLTGIAMATAMAAHASESQYYQQERTPAVYTKTQLNKKQKKARAKSKAAKKSRKQNR